MSKLRLWRTVSFICVFCMLAVIGLPAETFRTLVSFNRTDGNSPQGGVIQGLDGNLYGTTYYGGASSTCRATLGCGTVFKSTTGGTLTTLHNFDGADGANPFAGLVQATDGNFYGQLKLAGLYKRAIKGTDI
jgi:uncharacterized repeat protein (TIGR03803 family)